MDGKSTKIEVARAIRYLAERLSLSERSRRMGELEAQNRAWLERKCEELGASWLIVVDGEVLIHGATLADYVTDDALREWCEQTGKLPLVYEHPRSLDIEESAPWHLTAYPQDAYPTLELAMVGNGKRADLVVDFDIGSLETYANLDSLRAQGIVQIAPQDVLRQHAHLGQAFAYFVKQVTFLLTSEDGIIKQSPRGIRCVLNWQQSPFVRVNPSRQALAGRGIGLQFSPLLTLDFARRETKLHWQGTASSRRANVARRE